MSRLIETGADVVSSMLKIWLGILIFVLVVLAVGWYALFHGYFDHGLFEIKQVEWSSSTPRRVAVVAERSDHEALGGLEFFVLINDHVPSPTELRFANHSDHVIFSAASDCLSVSWMDSDHLLISCRDGTIDSAHINVRKERADDVSIAYVNIAHSTAKEFKPGL
jgi:hypothetical protein